MGRGSTTREALVDAAAGLLQEGGVAGVTRNALKHPELFKLTYGPWRVSSIELVAAADAARSSFVEAVAAAQEEGDLPSGDPERLTALLLALAHGASHLALIGHLAKDGKGHADASDLVDDLIIQLRTG